MLPDRVSNPGPLTYESGALPIALRGPAKNERSLSLSFSHFFNKKKNVAVFQILTFKILMKH